VAVYACLLGLIIGGASLWWGVQNGSISRSSVSQHKILAAFAGAVIIGAGTFARRSADVLAKSLLDPVGGIGRDVVSWFGQATSSGIGSFASLAIGGVIHAMESTTNPDFSSWFEGPWRAMLSLDHSSDPGRTASVSPWRWA
jgi:hypothetical protein